MRVAPRHVWDASGRHGDDVFIGEYRHSIDEKGRIAVPVRFRAQLAETAFVSKWIDTCVAIFPPRAFEELADKVAALPVGDPSARAFNRYVFASAFDFDLDRQGRGIVPAALREFAGLSGETVVVGAHDHVELWSPDRWASYSAAMTAPDVLAEHLQGLGI
jgi:MraZ protein